MSFVENYITKETAEKAKFDFSRPHLRQDSQGNKQVRLYPGLIRNTDSGFLHMNIVEVVYPSGKREIHFGTMVGQKYTRTSITPEYKQYMDDLLQRKTRIAGKDLEKAILDTLKLSSF